VKKNWLCIIEAILALFIVVLSLFASGCLFRPSSPPAEISGHVITSEKVDSATTTILSPRSDYIYWVVKLTVKNSAYKSPIEISFEEFLGSGGWAIAQKNTNYTLYIQAFSESGSLATGQSGEFTALLTAPLALSVEGVQVVYKGQEPYSFSTLMLEDKVAAYDWDTKTVTGTIPSKSYAYLILTILFGIILAALRFYPEVNGLMSRGKVAKGKNLITEARLSKTLNHPIFGVLSVVVVGVLIYYLYPLIDYKAIIAAVVIALPLLYVSVIRIRDYIQARRIEEQKRLEEYRRIQEERRRIEEERIKNEAEQRKAEEDRKKAEAEQLRIAEIALSRGDFDAYADDYLDLPWWGTGEKGMGTKEFADSLGLQKSEANKLLESWRAVGKVTRRLTNKGYVWWHM
jgi:hypothetical protein